MVPKNDQNIMYIDIIQTTFYKDKDYKRAILVKNNFFDA